MNIEMENQAVDEKIDNSANNLEDIRRDYSIKSVNDQIIEHYRLEEKFNSLNNRMLDRTDRLDEKSNNIRTEINNFNTDVSNIKVDLNNIRDDLSDDINGVEIKFNEKIDKVGKRIDRFETRFNAEVGRIDKDMGRLSSEMSLIEYKTRITVQFFRSLNVIMALTTMYLVGRGFDVFVKQLGIGG
ncbi:hypothetical protein CR532_04815 (plasmid) [Candidatus Borreliella tachyglossi]|uniref:Uncharacterized protein n=1 Tax=Candidatus Borreliella tachyglossi TaxID=1964448 RepID=A0A2S1LYG4_9SPIR|nr:hypothetical protein [Candidatus Borreliella tachyglossi]AWG43322.1 hypothetical protein CR532_04815 [Candidatus Borreliella tachyglossi]